MNALLVFVGGGLGAVARWQVGVWLPSPWSTLLVNVLGSLLLAIVAHPSSGLSDPVRLTVGTGVMGGFTTYSTFNLEVLVALQRGQPGRALAIAGGSLALCLLGGFLGWTAVERLRSPG